MLFLNGYPPLSLMPPFASFWVTSPALPDRPVTYINRSWDPAPTHHIILEVWSGRRRIFTMPGPHIVTLWVEDDRGLWASCTRTVLVLRPSRPPSGGAGGGGNKAWSRPHLQVSLSATTAARGDVVHVTLKGPPGLKDVHFILPSAFLPDIHAWTALDYRTANSRPLSYRDGAWRGDLYVPWSRTRPADGRHSLKIQATFEGRRVEAPFTLDVSGTLRYMEPRLSLVLSPG